MLLQIENLKNKINEEKKAVEKTTEENDLL